MKKLIMSTAMFIASMGAVFSQTYQHDFQKIIGVSGESVKNYTLCETNDNGFALVSFLQANGSMDQNKIQIFKTDADLNVILTQRFEYNAVGLYGFEITPNDIYETSTGDFIIAGGMINEGDPSKSGGFLMLIKNHSDEKLEFGWMQIYPSNNVPGIMPMRSLTRVVETHKGYMAIGRGSNFLVDGIVIKTDDNGNVLWSKHLYDEEYEGNQYSDLTDMVYVNEEEVAIVGTVNGFPQDDADINIVRINYQGEIISNTVYEYLYEPKDREFTYLERGAAIEFNKRKSEFVVAGTVTKKLEGICVEGEYKNILTFGIDYKSGTVNWSTRHDIGADNTLANESIYCSDIDFSGKDFGISGTVKNGAFGKFTNYNGFILRLNGEAYSSDLRFYGLSSSDYLNRIYSREGKYVAGGTLNKTNNYPWLIESYNSILETCNSVISDPKTEEYPLLYRKGLSTEVSVKNTKDVMYDSKTSYFEDVLCERKMVEAGIHAPQVTLTGVTESELSAVYPTIVRDGQLTIENNTGLVTYYITSINGAVLTQNDILTNGVNIVSVDQLEKGMYLVVGLNKLNEQQIFKVIVE